MLAQITIREGNFNATGVSDEGVVVGHIGENSPYYLWDTRSGSFQKIGGLSAGNNVGGWGSISADGRYVSGSTAHTHEIDTRVQRVEIQEKYQFTQVWPYGSSVFAIGKNDENKQGIIVQSFDKGKTWKQNTNVPRLTENGLESICFLNDFTGVIGGWDGLFLYTTNGGGTWSVSPVRPGEQDNVKVYRALSSYNVNQVVALAELQDGKRKVYSLRNPTKARSRSMRWHATTQRPTNGKFWADWAHKAGKTPAPAISSLVTDKPWVVSLILCMTNPLSRAKQSEQRPYGRPRATN